MKSISLYVIISILVTQIACKPVVAPDKEGLNEDSKVHIHKKIEAYLIYKGIDPNAVPDGFIDNNLIQNVDTLRISLDSASYGSLTGLKHFSSLKYLSLVSSVYFVSHSGNELYPNFKIPLDTLDVSENKSLEYLDCAGLSSGGGISPLIAHLIVGDNPKLKTLIAGNNLIGQLDLSAAINLETVALSSNRYMSAISLCDNKHLKRFFGQLMQVSVATAGQMEQFRKENPDSKFTLCP